MNLETILQLLVLAFPVSEVALAMTKRAQSETASLQDRGSMRLLWIVIMTAVALALALSGFAPARMHLPKTMRVAAALLLVAGGLLLRWLAILTLGKFFTTNVAIHHDHRVVDTGLYRYVRHPSYSGMLLAFLGVGLSFGSWLSLAVLMVPITLAVLHRIRLEESALSGSLGSAYSDYCARTKRLIPGVV